MCGLTCLSFTVASDQIAKIPTPVFPFPQSWLMASMEGSRPRPSMIGESIQQGRVYPVSFGSDSEFTLHLPLQRSSEIVSNGHDCEGGNDCAFHRLSLRGSARI